MKKNHRILIIYNPKSTSGKSNLRAIRLAKQLARKKFTNVSLEASQYAGHAEELAYNETIKHNQSLIISVSGDGGYNEVINGIIKAKARNKKSQAVCAILAAGNANDHRRATYKRPLIRSILRAEPEPLDILEVAFNNKKCYAHSYMGIGLTGKTVSELNKESLTRWKEIKIVSRNLLNVRHFSMKGPSGKNKSYDSVVFSNIHRMSKVIKMDSKTSINDGLFNVAAIEHRSRIKFLYILLKLAIVGGKHFPKASSYEFKLSKPQIGQLDGEVIALPANTAIHVSINNKLIKTIR